MIKGRIRAEEGRKEEGKGGKKGEQKEEKRTDKDNETYLQPARIKSSTETCNELTSLKQPKRERERKSEQV